MLVRHGPCATGRVEVDTANGLVEIRSRDGGPRYLHATPVFKDEPHMPVQAVLDNLADGMSPDAVANAYQIDLRLVNSVKQFAESQRFAHSV